MRSERCWQIVVDEFDFLLGLPEYVWITVADVLKDIDHRILKAHVVEASLVSMAYIHLERFAPLTKPPFKYIVGDCAENLQGLKNEIGVTDPVASKMQTLSFMGYDDDVLAACMLVRESSLSTTLVEQAHASGAIISNRHPQLEQAQLVSRMTIHNCRALFSAGKYEKQQLRLSTLLSQIDTQMRNAHRAGPREQYVNMFIAEVKSTRPVYGPSDHAIRRSIFKHHAKTYACLDAGQIGALRVKARAHAKAKIDDLSSTKEHVLSQLALLHSRQQEQKQQGFPNHIESVKFGDDEFSRFAELWAESAASSDAWQIPPPPRKVPPAMEMLLQEKITAQTRPKPPSLSGYHRFCPIEMCVLAVPSTLLPRAPKVMSSTGCWWPFVSPRGQCFWSVIEPSLTSNHHPMLSHLVSLR